MEKKPQKMMKQAMGKILQSAIKREAYGWPPDCAGFFYQPYRPEKDLPKSQPKK